MYFGICNISASFSLLIGDVVSLAVYASFVAVVAVVAVVFDINLVLSVALLLVFELLLVVILDIILDIILSIVLAILVIILALTQLRHLVVLLQILSVEYRHRPQSTVKANIVLYTMFPDSVY